jgi:HEAT repeat protein
MSSPSHTHPGARLVLQQLLDGLEHSDAAVRQHAMLAWMEVAEALTPAVAALGERLEDQEPGVPEAAMRALAALGRQAALALPPVRAALKRLSLSGRHDGSLRTAAVEALHALGNPPLPPVAELVQALHDPSAPVRFGAAQALSERGADGDPAVGTLLELALHDPDPAVRLEAAVALYRIDRRADIILPLFIRVLREPDEARRWIAADCLRGMGPAAREAVPALLEGLDGHFHSVMVRNSFLLALNRIDPEAAARAGFGLSS